MAKDIESIHKAIDLAVKGLVYIADKNRGSQVKLAEAVRQAVMIISSACMGANETTINLPRRYAIEKRGTYLILSRRHFIEPISVAEIDVDIASGENDTYGTSEALLSFTLHVCSGLLDDILDNLHKDYMDTASAASSLHNESIRFLRELYQRYWGKQE